mgnify:CR=1 FL=1
MKKEAITSICSWKDADRTLGRIARLQGRLGRMRARADERMSKIEERLGEESAGFLSEVEDLRQELERFFRENSDGLRSRTLPSGRIGLRFLTRLEIARPKTTLHRLAQRGLGDCIRIRQEIDRQALRRLDSDALRSVGVKRVTRETFYVVPKAKK